MNIELGLSCFRVEKALFIPTVLHFLHLIFPGSVSIGIHRGTTFSFFKKIAVQDFILCCSVLFN